MNPPLLLKGNYVFSITIVGPGGGCGNHLVGASATYVRTYRYSFLTLLLSTCILHEAMHVGGTSEGGGGVVCRFHVYISRL